jgi:glycosyltransferase involved in cell wall biosynthesis
LRIAHVIDYFMPESGFAEYYVVKKLQELGHDVCVITSDLSKISQIKHKPGQSAEEGIQVFRIKSYFKSFSTILVSINDFEKTLSNFAPDIVHIYWVGSPLALATAFYKQKYKYKIVSETITGKVMARGFDLAVKKVFFEAYKKVIWPFMFSKIDGFRSISKASTDWMKSELKVDPSELTNLPHGSDTDLFYYRPDGRIKIRNQLNLKKNDVVAIYTGKMLPHKKLDILLLSTADLLQNHHNYKIIFVGKGPPEYIKYINKIITEHKIKDNIIFCNWVHRTELPNYYSAADFAVWPGHHSISIIEAISTKLPVIIPISDWLNHFVKNENGFKYSEGNISELTHYMTILFTNSELRRQMGENSQKLVEKEYNWLNIVNNYIKMYTSLLNK